MAGPKLIEPDFPDLPDRLRKIVPTDEYREWKKRMEEWRKQQAVSMDKFVESTIVPLINKLAHGSSGSGLLPVLGVMLNQAPFAGGAFSPYLLKLDGAANPLIKQSGKLVLRIVSPKPLAGKLVAFSPPPDFWVDVLMQKSLPAYYPFDNFNGAQSPPMAMDTASLVIKHVAARLGPEMRQLYPTEEADLAVNQLWRPSYVDQVRLIYLSTTDIADYAFAQSVGKLSGAPVFSGSWFDLNVDGAGWQTVLGSDNPGGSTRNGTFGHIPFNDPVTPNTATVATPIASWP